MTKNFVSSIAWSYESESFFFIEKFYFNFLNLMYLITQMYRFKIRSYRCQQLLKQQISEATFNFPDLFTTFLI